LSCIALLIAGCVAFVVIDDNPRHAIFHPEGALSLGKEFGVEKGMTRTAAVGELTARGWNLVTSEYGGDCHGRHYPPSEILDAYYLTGVTKGVICVASSDEKVNALTWKFSWGVP
jgi:hypothetical protein